jgi:hypothetical protein
MMISRESKQSHVDKIKSNLDIFHDSLVPWANKSPEHKTDIEDMAESWIKIFGDPNDPEVKKKIDDSVEVLLRR